MIRHLRARDRRGVSVIVGYVLLIVLAVGMAAGVYSFLKFYVPKNQPQCPDGTSLIVQNISCTGSVFKISLTNRGLFTIDGAFIKVGEVERTYKVLINCPNPAMTSLDECSIYFNNGNYLTPLKAGESWSKSFPYAQGIGMREVEVEPLIVVSNETHALCEKAVVVRNVECT